jgi:hypothetical protein
VHRTRVYSDVVPYINLADDSYTSYGSYTPNDARNEAYHNVPRYFRKSDLLRAAVEKEDGTLSVPAYAKPRMDVTVVRPFGMTTRPMTPKGTILIIPKDLLKQPVKKTDPSLVAAE